MRYFVIMSSLLAYSLHSPATDTEWKCFDQNMCIESLIKLSDGGGFACTPLTKSSNCKNHFKEPCLHEMPELKVYYKMFNAKECKASQKLIESVYPK